MYGMLTLIWYDLIIINDIQLYILLIEVLFNIIKAKKIDIHIIIIKDTKHSYLPTSNFKYSIGFYSSYSNTLDSNSFLTIASNEYLTGVRNWIQFIQSGYEPEFSK